jgi:phosphatidylglycerol:prolipoprotein diacylglycerol transferase
MIHVPTSPFAHAVFDLLAWSGGLGLSYGLYRWRLGEAVAQIANKTAPGYFIALVAGAIPGAWLAGSLNTLRTAAPSLSHSVAGALAGAIIGVEIYKRARRITGSTGVVFVGAFALGIVIGRLGCFFSGLADATFGAPTTLPWAVDLGDGIGRHPVQLYESLSMAAFLAVYLAGLRRRAPWALRRSFYALCIWYGAQRFAWEFFKPYPPVVGPFNLFHILCGGLIAYGCVYWLGDLRGERRTQERALSVPRPDHQPL